MSHTDQLSRQWVILKLLEVNRRITLQQIGDALDEPCHERTLRRDLDVLSLAGFQIYSEREDGKRYWKLLDDHKAIPFPLTPTELYALQCGRNLRTFATERISAVTITEDRFQIPFYFSIGDYFKDAFGVYRGEAEAVVLRFDKPASLSVRSRLWHASQKLTRLPRERIELKFQVAVTPELMQWVLSFGAQVEVIAPKRLKTMIENEAWRLLGRYQEVKMGRKKKVLKKEKK